MTQTSVGALRDPEGNRARLIQAGLDVMAERYTSPHTKSPVLPITVSEVLERTGSDAPEGGRLTTGAVKHAFGDRAAFLTAIAEEMLAVDRVLGEFTRYVTDLLLTASDDGPALRNDLALQDLANMTTSLAVTRHWFAAHSQAGNPALASQLRRLYEGLDELMVPLLAKIGGRESRAPIPGLTWAHVANALTAWTEGTALRYHYVSDGHRETPWQTRAELEPLFLKGADALWMGLTTQASRPD